MCNGFVTLINSDNLCFSGPLPALRRIDMQFRLRYRDHNGTNLL